MFKTKHPLFKFVFHWKVIRIFSVFIDIDSERW